jgi:hypothetical protein
LQASVTVVSAPVGAHPDPPGAQAVWISFSPQSPELPGASAQPIDGQAAAENDEQAASGYCRSTPLLQFQSHDPLGAAVVWNVSSGCPGVAEQAAVEPPVHMTFPITPQAPTPG